MPAWSAQLYSPTPGDGTVTSAIGEAILTVRFGQQGFKYLLESSVSVSSVQPSRTLQLHDKILTS